MPNHTIINAININQSCFNELYIQTYAPAKILANVNKETTGLPYTDISQTNLNWESTNAEGTPITAAITSHMILNASTLEDMFGN